MTQRIPRAIALGLFISGLIGFGLLAWPWPVGSIAREVFLADGFHVFNEAPQRISFVSFAAIFYAVVFFIEARKEQKQLAKTQANNN